MIRESGESDLWDLWGGLSPGVKATSGVVFPYLGTNYPRGSLVHIYITEMLQVPFDEF